MRVKIFANNINHLTDARYFAAWGASWMCYNVNSLSLTEISAIKEWVEGPKHIINVIGIDPSEAAAMLTHEAIDGYLTDNIKDHNRIQSLLQRELDAFLLDTKSENATTIIKVKEIDVRPIDNVICDIEGSSKEVIDFIEKYKPATILLAGSEEEVVGVKSFDQLDEILESLEDKDL